MAHVMAADPVVAFYSGGRDTERRTLEELWSWPDDRLEAVHDYIQWMFPTAQPSGANPVAPLVTPQTIRTFEADARLRDRLRHSLDRMLSFYGLRRIVTPDAEQRIDIEAGRFAERAANWLHPGNHNHLRLTRMMESLATLGLLPEARALQRCLLEDVCEGPGRERVSRRTVEFWRQAVVLS